MEHFGTDEWITINRIADTLRESDIVWPRYGEETVEDLAIKIFKIARSAHRQQQECLA
jgi:hypothetical protein